MILHRLMLQDFRGVTREEVEIPAQGVLVVEGPNESGKTSLMDALEMLLEHKASSGRADIKATKPVGRDVPVVVEAEFTIDDLRLCYRKEFVKGKQTSLHFPGSAREALSGDDAHNYVRDLLESKVDRSLWRALRIAQDEPIGQVNAAEGMDSLRRALDAAAGGEDPTGDDSLIAQVTEERNRYLTAQKGGPTGDLARSEARLAEARELLTKAKAEHAELDAAVDAHAQQAAVHRSHSEAQSALETEVTRLEAAAVVVSERRQVASDAGTRVDRAAAEHDAAVRGVRDRAELVSEVERERDRTTAARKAVEAAADRLGPAQERADGARESLEAAEAALTRARASLDRARLTQESEHRRREYQRLDTLIDTVEGIGDELSAVDARLTEVAIPDDAVERIRSADESLREAVVRSTASAPTVEVAGSGQLVVAGESREADPAWTERIVDDTVFEIGDISLTVSPAGDTDAVRREETSARRRLETVLREIGVADRAEVEERARLVDSLRGQVEALRRRRTDLLAGETLDDLRTRRDALRNLLTDADPQEENGGPEDDAGPEVTTDQVDAPVAGFESPPELADPAATAADAETLVVTCRGADRAAAAEAETVRTEHATRVALAEEAESRRAERATVLERARETASDSQLSETEEAARKRLDEARADAHKARTALDDALADAPPEVLDNARASLTALQNEERESAAAVATALGRVNAIVDQGRLGDVSAADRELDEAERENSALWRRARAADLLLRTLTTRRSEALRAYQEPFHRAVVELGSLVYGRDFDVQLGEDLTIRSRRIGDVTVNYDSLSGGAREQLAVIVRIACARLVGTGGVPVFLDDTMGYTDPGRRLTMGNVIASAAGTSQVIVLTCDRARFAGVGGARTHVMRRTAAATE